MVEARSGVNVEAEDPRLPLGRFDRQLSVAVDVLEVRRGAIGILTTARRRSLTPLYAKATRQYSYLAQVKRKKAGKTFFSAAVAYHEAGHAVARVYLGARVTDTKVFKDGTGFSDGAVAEWHSGNAGAGQSWDLLLMLMAGVHAEARATKRSLKVLRLSKGLQDFAIATVLVDMMAKHSKKLSAKAIWRQADRERTYFLRHCWHTIERVGAQLMRTGFVSAADLKRMTKSYRRHQLAQRPCL